MIKNIILDFGDVLINLDKPATAREMLKFGFTGITPELDELFKDSEIAYMLYNHMLAPEQRASNCAECGECEEHCPQHLEVREELKRVHERLAEE